MVTNAPSPSRKSWRLRLPALLTGVVLLGGAMAVTATLAPALALAPGGAQPDYGVIVLVGLAMIGLSATFLAVARRVIGLDSAWLWLVQLTNLLVLGAEFILIPYVFYQTTFLSGPGSMHVDAPNFFPGVAGGLFLLDVMVVGLIYLLQHGTDGRPLRPASGLMYVGVLLSGLLCAGVALLMVAGIQLTGGIELVTGAGLLAIAVAAIAMNVAAGLLWRAGQTAVSLRGTAALTSVMWLAVAMLLVYHVIWVVFMGVLIGLWPLRVVAPSGK